jgi:hypothetical protein
VVSSDRTPTFRRHFGLIVRVTALWLPLSMLFNSLQSLVLRCSSYATSRRPTKAQSSV